MPRGEYLCKALSIQHGSLLILFISTPITPITVFFMCLNNLSPTFSAQNEVPALFGESLISLPLVNLVSQQDAFGGDDPNGA